MVRATLKKNFLRFFPAIFSVLMTGLLMLFVLIKKPEQTMLQKPIAKVPNQVKNVQTVQTFSKTALMQVKSTDPEVRIGENVVHVDLATTPDERMRGLSGRTSLEKDHGLLFVFEKPDKYGFWMKDMLFSIDIIWISPEHTIIHIEKDLSPETYPQDFTPQSDALYVLEVPAGFSDEKQIKIGDEVQFSNIP